MFAPSFRLKLRYFCYSRQTHWQYLLPRTRHLLEQTQMVGLAIWQVCAIFFFDMLWGVGTRSGTKKMLSYMPYVPCMPYRKQRQNLKTLCFQGSSSCLFLPIRSQPSQYSQWGKGFQINEHYHHKESLYIPKVTLVSLGKQRAIYSSASAATLIKTRSARNGVVHVIDSLVWKCWDNPKTKLCVWDIW